MPSTVGCEGVCPRCKPRLVEWYWSKFMRGLSLNVGRGKDRGMPWWSAWHGRIYPLTLHFYYTRFTEGFRLNLGATLRGEEEQSYV